jgi:hypothetical protein
MQLVPITLNTPVFAAINRDIKYTPNVTATHSDLASKCTNDI